MINENLFKGKWQEIKGDFQKQWGKLTGDEVDQSKGDYNTLIGSIQQKYGMAQEEARKSINDWFSKFTDTEKSTETNNELTDKQ